MRASKSINGFLLSDRRGLNSRAFHQGGMVMLPTVVIITMPTVAAALWQCSKGSFMHFSAFSGGGTSSLGTQGQPVGSYVPPRINDASTSTGNASTQSLASS
jgi:type IV secretion system protein VirB6